jgi:hypothetical protein
MVAGFGGRFRYHGMRGGTEIEAALLQAKKTIPEFLDTVAVVAGVALPTYADG